MAEPNPIENEELFDVIVLRGATSPGVVTLRGHDREIGWDVKKGPGQSGATTERTSEDPVEFVASFKLTTLDEIAAWPDFRDVLLSTVSGAQPVAAEIYHPDLAANDIKSVVLKKLGGVQHDGDGGQTIEVSLLEYRPPKKKGGSPNGSKSKAKKPDPDQAALDEIAALTKKYEATPWG